MQKLRKVRFGTMLLGFHRVATVHPELSNPRVREKPSHPLSVSLHPEQHQEQKHDCIRTAWKITRGTHENASEEQRIIEKGAAPATIHMLLPSDSPHHHPMEPSEHSAGESPLAAHTNLSMQELPPHKTSDLGLCGVV